MFDNKQQLLNFIESLKAFYKKLNDSFDNHLDFKLYQDIRAIDLNIGANFPFDIFSIQSYLRVNNNSEQNFRSSDSYHSSEAYRKGQSEYYRTIHLSQNQRNNRSTDLIGQKGYRNQNCYGPDSGASNDYQKYRL